MKSSILFIALFVISSSAWAHEGASNTFIHLLQHVSLYFGISVVVGVACLLVVRALFPQVRSSRSSAKI